MYIYIYIYIHITTVVGERRSEQRRSERSDSQSRTAALPRPCGRTDALSEVDKAGRRGPPLYPSLSLSLSLSISIHIYIYR